MTIWGCPLAEMYQLANVGSVFTSQDNMSTKFAILTSTKNVAQKNTRFANTHLNFKPLCDYSSCGSRSQTQRFPTV